ncbi:protein-glutamate O-methyltransferase CheR [Erythrobacter sp. HL-111]|uniref:CheR family methyltransferase n=1 Tax=Erythrobacter sp. HL-111 TaxID=1798193 RepID=UPI0006DA97B5|nr:CheR family methyltransferase [Erythrobacter sp. HL-111]KPP96321.1 MAG: chemotaxis protein methyltransferase CheR [Erythrobacteraceae bacterium HL-111]SDR73517.1 chemotaxis protein methyltransferase CheR [Erythrobacter sp. HL-111]
MTAGRTLGRDVGEAEDAMLVPGISPMVYSQADFLRIAELARIEAGIVLGERKRMLAYSRLAPLVRRSGRTTFGDYLDLIETDPGEAMDAIAALTTNHTYFNREPHHFAHFEAEVRPALVARASAGGRVRLWSAGCSSGEEVWTLMMVLLGEDRGAGRRIAGRDVIALASDLSGRALARAKAATYPAEALGAMPERLRANWTLPAGANGPARLAIGPEPRAMVRFRQLNLLRPWPFNSLFDVIFCRNVMIYFDAAAKEQLVLALARQLVPGGYLYIGHSERVSGEATGLIDPVGPTIYRRRAP